MKYIRSVWAKLINGKLVAKLKKIKNVELVIAVILALIAALCFFAASAKKKTKSASTAPATTAVAQMDEREEKLAAVISKIAGVGRSRVMISSGEGSEVAGVVVVAEGANKVETRVKIVRCVEKATGVSVDRIEVFEMGNGG